MQRAATRNRRCGSCRHVSNYCGNDYYCRTHHNDSGTDDFDCWDNYDGTNSGATSGAHFVFDSGSRTLYHDDDPSQDGYTVVATVQSGASIAGSDIGLVTS